MNHEANDGRRAVIVGAGFGGLALAIRLQAAGMQVTVLEKRERIGGRAYQLKDRGYTFDMGPSLITAPGIIDAVFQAAGRRLVDYVDLVPLDPFYRIHFHDGTHIDYVSDAERMKEQMARFNPGDAARYDDFMAAIEPIYGAVIEDRLGSKPFDSWGKMLGFLPRVAKLGAWRPVHNFVARYFEDFRHRFVYSFHPLFVGGNPFSAPSVYLMIPMLEKLGGVWFSRGGMYSVVEAMGRVFEEIGGEIRTDHEVERIEVTDGRATAVRAAGTTFPADVVVSNADVGHTYGALVEPEKRRHWTDRRIDRTHYTMSCFLLYVGTRRTWPEVAHHTLILSERYRELVRDIFDRKVLPDDFSMYVHAPTRTDPDMAPEGCESMYVLIPVANKRADIDWDSVKEPLAERVLEFLEEWGMEGLRDALEVLHIFTPDDFETELNATFGNAFAVEPRLTQTAYLRPQNRSEDVDGLYLVGAGTHPGAGVPGVILSAEATYSCIAEDEGLEAQWEPATPGDVRMEPTRGPGYDAAMAELPASAGTPELVPE
ncbi:phytoene desaturase [Gaopeijia maritima]|uniref:Phytoene dehydrogenase n=1 Tax=Gaopeijia maritima TaxID=3119007 RepID=A0ABU9E6J0_9BACT